MAQWRMKKINLKILEKNPEMSGTWFENVREEEKGDMAGIFVFVAPFLTTSSSGFQRYPGKGKEAWSCLSDRIDLTPFSVPYRLQS